MRPNRADSALSQYFCSLLTAVLLLVSLLCFRRLHRTLISKLPEDGPAPCAGDPSM